jgi:hypothetical protein
MARDFCTKRRVCNPVSPSSFSQGSWLSVQVLVNLACTLHPSPAASQDIYFILANMLTYKDEVLDENED